MVEGVFTLPSDIGGSRLGEPIDRSENPPANWHLLSAGVRGALIAKGLLSKDEGRRAVEELGPERYSRWGYEERKIAALEGLLVEKALLTLEDLGRRPEDLPEPPVKRRLIAEAARERAADAHASPAFQSGDSIKIRDDWPPGHLRTPGYLRGKPGRIIEVHGPFRNPETLAYGHDGLPTQWLYTIEFRRARLWEEPSTDDVILADIYEHWIVRTDGSDQ